MSVRALLALVVCASVLVPVAARAQQDFPEQQRIVGDILAAGREREARVDALQRRRAQAAAQAAAQRAARQAALLEAQAGEVRALRGELQALRAEREVVAAADAFDAAYAARDWAGVRALLADTVVLAVPDGARTLAADALIAEWAARGRAAGVPARSGARVRLEGDQAVLTSMGVAAGWARAGSRGAGGVGEYEHSLVRTPAGWRIAGLSFRPRA